MRYRTLGHTGLLVSEICLGTMTFGGAAGLWGAIAGVDQSAAEAILRRSLEAGVNFIDTAEVYEVSALPPEYPGWMIESQGAPESVAQLLKEKHG